MTASDPPCEFALNFSPQAAELLRVGQIQIDRFKVPDWPDQVDLASTLRPVYVHFPLQAHDLSESKLAAAIGMMRETHTPFLNLHLSARRREFPDDPSAALIASEEGIRRAMNQAGPRSVIVENIPTGNPHEGFLDAIVDPANITALVKRTGCGLLLDLSHARLAAMDPGVDWRDYVDQLPMDALQELHLTGLGQHDGRWVDHMPMQPADWTATQWAIDRIAQGDWPKPRMIACEYGGVGAPFAWRSESSVIARDVPRLVEMLAPIAG